jgi:hypothetical protein
MGNYGKAMQNYGKLMRNDGKLIETVVRKRWQIDGDMNGYPNRSKKGAPKPGTFHWIVPDSDGLRPKYQIPGPINSHP